MILLLVASLDKIISAPENIKNPWGVLLHGSIVLS